MSLLTKENLDVNDDGGKERLKETNDFDNNFRDVYRDRALKIYKNELNRPSSLDLGLHGVTRAALRTLCKNVVLESSKSMKRRYSYSALSSSIHSLINNDNNNAISALRTLQKERLIVSRLGFPDKAMDLDKEIEIMREKAKKVRAEEEAKILYQRMKTLAITHHRKEQRLEFILAEEARQMNEHFEEEERKVLKRQEVDFLSVLENATRRAIGRVKKCSCEKSYTCRHNKIASYNTRRPTHQVIQYRRNAKRLKRAGRPEEAAAWEEKAKELDEQEQERWRARIAESIVSSPWGANEAAVDQITEMHKRELAVLRKTHEVKRDMHEKKQSMRRKNFRNTILAEERKVRMQCRKLALLRVRRDYDKEQRESKRQERIAGHSDGLKNISKNLLGEQFDDDEKKQVDWVPPSSFGLDNSVRLIDAVKELNPGLITAIDSENISGRILTSRKDIARMTPEQLRAKIHSNLKRDNSEEDSDSDEEGTSHGDGNEGIVNKLGVTSGYKLVDNLRQNKANKKDEPASVFSPASPSLASSTTALGGWSGTNNSNFGRFPVKNISMFPVPNAMAASPFPATPSTAAFKVTPMINGFRMGDNTTNNAFWGNSSEVGGNPFGSWNSNHPFNSPCNAASTGPSTNALAAPAQPSTPAPSTPSFRTGMHLAGTSTNNLEPKPATVAISIPFPTLAYQQQSSSTMQQQFQQQMSNTDHLQNTNNQMVAPASPDSEYIDADDSKSVDRGSEQDGKGSAVSSANKKPLPGRTIYVFDPVEDTKPVLFKPGSVRDDDWFDHDRAIATGNGVENSYGVSTIDKYAVVNNIPSEKSAEETAHAVVSPQASPSKSPAFPPDTNNKAKAAVEESVNETIAPVSASISVQQTTSSLPTNAVSNNTSTTANAFPVPSLNTLLATFQPFPTATDANPNTGISNTNIMATGNMPFEGFGVRMGNQSLFENASINPFAVTTSNKLAAANNPTGNINSFLVANQSNNNIPIAMFQNTPQFNASSPVSSVPTVTIGIQQQQASFATLLPSSSAPGTLPTTISLEADTAKLTLTVPFTPQPTMTFDTAAFLNKVETVGETENGNINPITALNASWNSQNSPSLRFGHQHEPPNPGTPESVPTKSALSHQSHYNKKGISLTKTEAKKSVQFGMNEMVTFETPVVEEEEVHSPVAPVVNAAVAVAKTDKSKKNIGVAVSAVSADASSGTLDDDNRQLDVEDEPSSLTDNKPVHVPSDMDHLEKETPPHKYVVHHPESSIKDTGNAQFPPQSLPFATTNNIVSFSWESDKGSPAMSCNNNPFNNSGNSFSSMSASTFTQPERVISSSSIVPHAPATPKSETTSFHRPAAKLHPSQTADHTDTTQDTCSNNTNTKALNAKEIQQIQTIATRIPTSYSARSSMDMMSMVSMNSIGDASGTNANLSATSTRSSLDMTMTLTEQKPIVFVEDGKSSELQPKSSNSPPSIPDITQLKIDNPFESSFNINNNSISIANNNKNNTFNTTIDKNATSWGAMISSINDNSNNNNVASSLSSTMSNPFGSMSSSFPATNISNAGSFGSTLSFMSTAIPAGNNMNNTYPFTNKNINSTNNMSLGNISFPATNNFPSFPNNPSPAVTNTVTPMTTVHHTTSPPSLHHPHKTDFLQDYQHETQSASTDDTTYLMKGEPNWDLALFRIANLDNVHQTLEFILNDADLYEAAELYISTIGSYHHDHVNTTEEMDRGESVEHEKELHVHELNMKLQLLHGWKRYMTNVEDNEGLLMGLEEVLGLEQEEVVNHLSDCLKHNEQALQQIFHELAYAFVPEFVLSSDFEAYFETHSPVKAHNKKLRIDSKSWLGKFENVVNTHSIPFQLFLFHGGSDHRPYANQCMRALFGPMCDAPSPKEYIDMSHNDQQMVEEFLSALQNGKDISSGILCRTLKNDRPPAILSLKHMHSFNHPEVIKYSLVNYHDMSQPDAEMKLKVVQAILKSIP